MKKYIFSSLFALFSAHSFAADSFSDCAVEDIRFGSDDRNGHVKLSCSITDGPECASSTGYVAFDKSTELGKQRLSLFLTAFAGNFKVRGKVIQDCPDWQTNVALLDYIVLMK